MIDQIVNFLRNLTRFNQAVESLAVDVIASYTPWLAPAIPAYMTWQHMVSILNFPWWMGVIGALIVEFLGLSAIQTVFQFIDFNQVKRERDGSAPVAAAVLTGAFYLAVVLIVNTMLDNTPTIERVARGLLSTLSVPAGVILAVRAGQAKRLAGIDQERQERREARRVQVSATRASTQDAQVARNFTQGFDWRALPQEEREQVGRLTTRGVMKAYPGLPLRTAQAWKLYAQDNHNGHHLEESILENERMLADGNNHHDTQN